MIFSLRKGVPRRRNAFITLITILVLFSLPSGISSLTKNLTIESSGTVKYEPANITVKDDFSDDSIDEQFWSKLEVDGGIVTEQNGRLECNNPTPVAYPASGLASTDPVNLETCDISVEVNLTNNRMQVLEIALSKTVTSDPWYLADWYAIQKRIQGTDLRIQRKVDSVLTTIYSAPWSGGTGSIGITINAGVIHLYEAGVEKYNESYALSDYNCYVYIYTGGGEGYGGIDWFDNFSLTAEIPPPPPPPPPPPIIAPPLHVEGRYIKDDVGNTVLLRGTTLIHFLDDPSGAMNWGGWDPATVQANLDAMASWGINVVRLHTCAEWWLNNYQGYRNNMKDLIQWAGERGIYVIYDIYSISHLYSGWGDREFLPYPPYTDFHDNIQPWTKQDFVDFWASVANELKTYPNVLFEIWNEPYPTSGDKAVRDEFFDVVQDCIDAIRLDGSSAICIVQWGQLLWTGDPAYMTGNLRWVEEQLGRGLLTDPNIVYNGHIYRYHGSFGSMLGNVSYAYILQKMQDFQIPYVLDTLNKSVICCETGAYDSGTSEYQNELECLRNELSIMNEWGMSYLVFAWGDTPFNIITGSESGGPYDPKPSGQVLIDAIAPPI